MTSTHAYLTFHFSVTSWLRTLSTGVNGRSLATNESGKKNNRKIPQAVRASRKKGKFEGRVCKRDGACVQKRWGVWKRSNPSQDIGGKESAPYHNSPLSSPSFPCCDSALLLFAGDERERERVEEAIPLFSTTYSLSPLFLYPGSEPAKPHEAHFPLYTDKVGTGEREREGALVHD
jgi:hypothetical protein